MQYLFRNVAYKHKIIRFVKPPDIDSYGPRFTTNLAELQLLSQYIEKREPDTIVIALLGYGAIGCSDTDKIKGPLLRSFQKEYPRLPDSHYKWEVGEIVID